MRHTRKMNALAASTAVAALMAASPLAAETDNAPKMHEDGTWLTMTGTVAEASANNFILDYGQDTVTVELDEWGWYTDTFTGLPGDKVTVSGRVDKDGFEARKIEAAFVYLHDQFTYHYASPQDEEDVGYSAHALSLTPTDSNMSAVGYVDEIHDEEFILDTGYGEVRVDTRALPYNPLDEHGYQELEPGERVSVAGMLEPDSFDGFFEKREILAYSVIELSENPSSQSGS